MTLLQRTWVQVPALLALQLPVHVPGKAAGEDPSLWAPVPHGETQMECWVLGFSLTWLWLQWMGTFSVSLSNERKNKYVMQTGRLPVALKQFRVGFEPNLSPLQSCDNPPTPPPILPRASCLTPLDSPRHFLPWQRVAWRVVTTRAPVPVSCY